MVGGYPMAVAAQWRVREGHKHTGQSAVSVRCASGSQAFRFFAVANLHPPIPFAPLKLRFSLGMPGMQRGVPSMDTLLFASALPGVCLLSCSNCPLTWHSPQYSTVAKDGSPLVCFSSQNMQRAICFSADSSEQDGHRTGILLVGGL